MGFKLFRFDKYEKNPVLKEREAIRETESFWVFPTRVSRWHKKGEIKEGKNTEYNPAFRYYRTAEEAYAAFIECAKREIETLEKDLSTLRAALENVKELN